ncbi:predicted protein [Botrytis cinerea T4]|uniref:Uncharacterized protein n=1 Tax=Botryotinia fuckeliana (strain T4) TaxID=999810 RepID=G2XPJ5_BOTF4|nr:predicted protein [Botrytis cinerea T4]
MLVLYEVDGSILKPLKSQSELQLSAKATAYVSFLDHTVGDSELKLNDQSYPTNCIFRPAKYHYF